MIIGGRRRARHGITLAVALLLLSTGCGPSDNTASALRASESATAVTADSATQPDPIVGMSTADAPPVALDCSVLTDEDISTETGLTPVGSVDRTSGRARDVCTWKIADDDSTLIVVAVNTISYGMDNYIGECTPFSADNPPPLSRGPVTDPVANAVTGLGREARWCDFTQEVLWRTGGSFIKVGFSGSTAADKGRAASESLARFLYPLLDAGDPPDVEVERQAIPEAGSADNVATPQGCPITTDQASEILNTVIGSAEVDSDGTCRLQLGDPDGVVIMLSVNQGCQDLGPPPAGQLKELYPELVPGTKSTYGNDGFIAVVLDSTGTCAYTVAAFAPQSDTESILTAAAKILEK